MLDGDRIAAPLFFYDSANLDPKNILLCLQAAAGTDTSRWEMELRVEGRPSPSGWRPPALHSPVDRGDSTICFQHVLPRGLPEGFQRISAHLVDRFDGRSERFAGQPIYIRHDASAFARLKNRLEDLVVDIYREGFDHCRGDLDELLREAQEMGFPMLAVQMTLIATHFLTVEEIPEALQEAERRLDTLPAWIGDPLTGRQGAMAAYQWAVLHLHAKDRGKLKDAWRELAEASRRYQRIAHPDRIMAIIQEASTLHELGATGEAIERLSRALDECQRVACEPSFVEHARNNLTWYILLNPYVSARELEKARSLLLTPGGGTEDPFKETNRRITMAYLEILEAKDPDAHLAAARASLEGHRNGTERWRQLSDWIHLVEGQASLAVRDHEAALGYCGQVVARPGARLIPWALSCQIQAHAQAGRLVEAEFLFIRLQERFPIDQGGEVVQRLPVGLSSRADDFILVARLAARAKDFAKAWSHLVELDELLHSESERRRCREQGGHAQEWRELDEKIEELRARLLLLDAPAPVSQRDEQAKLRDDLKGQLQALWRQWPGCSPGESSTATSHLGSDQGVEYRAFAWRDEIILLHRRSDGTYSRAGGASYPRQKLSELAEDIWQGLARRNLDDDEWARLLKPMSEALLPDDWHEMDEVTTFALHGPLQAVPLTMLPLPEEARQSSGKRWLGELTAVAVHPAGALAEPQITDAAPLQPLFVVDPRSNLPAGQELLRVYRRLFPAARFLSGSAATREAFLHALRAGRRARWLHIDAHGLYDPAFPELTALELADRPIHWFELADAPMRFELANLSGCQTGRWPVTADSGSYGIGGLATRMGAAWAIASRNDLDDRVALDFNRELYTALQQGSGVPEAYLKALSRVSKAHPAGTWGGLVLLRAAVP